MRRFWFYFPLLWVVLGLSVAEWVHSHYRYNYTDIFWRGRSLGFGSDFGKFVLCRGTVDPGAFKVERYSYEASSGDVFTPTLHMGFGWELDDAGWILTIPWWSISLSAALGLLGMSVWNRRTKVRKLKKAGLCVACGYDLRASVGRCPECGTAFSRGEAAGIVAG